MGLMQKNDPRAIRAQQEHVQKMFDASISFNTRINYKSDLDKFLGFGYPLPADPIHIVKYLNHQARHYNPRTLDRHLKAIRYWHKINDFIDPTKDARVETIRKGIKNTYGTPVKKAKPFTLEDMHKINDYYKDKTDFFSLRNNAMLQIGFFGAFRRSELVKIHFEDLSLSDEGLTILIPRSKTDQEGLGENVCIPYMQGELCPVKILARWLLAADMAGCYIFTAISIDKIIRLSPLNCDTLYLIVKMVAEECGLEDPHLYSGHSLRRGCATESARNGAGMHSIMKHGRWKDLNTVAGYIDEACKFKDNAASFLDISMKK